MCQKIRKITQPTLAVGAGHGLPVSLRQQAFISARTRECMRPTYLAQRVCPSSDRAPPRLRACPGADAEQTRASPPAKHYRAARGRAFVVSHSELERTVWPKHSRNVRMDNQSHIYVRIRDDCSHTRVLCRAFFRPCGRGGGQTAPHPWPASSHDVRGPAATRPRACSMLHVRHRHPAKPGGDVRGLHSLAGASTRRRNLETRLAAGNTRQSDAPDARDRRRAR